MKKILSILLMTILSINISIAQKIIILKGDTLVTLEKKKVETLNEIALHREYLIRDLQLCDSIGAAEGVVSMEERMGDVKRRYGYYPQEKWDANFALKDYFSKKIGMDIYELLK